MPYRILSLNGGGIRGVFQAVYLEKVAAYVPKPFRCNFELIGGTSTGALLALGVALEIDLTRLVELFKRRGQEIFKPRLTRKLFGPFAWGPRYSGDGLRRILTEIFGARTLKECQTDVIITAAKLDRFGHRVFTTLPRSGGLPDDGNLSVVDVAMASCAAPTYFPAVRPAEEERTYVDGGVWANNPTLVAVIEARARNGTEFSDMRVVSVGNGEWAQGARATNYNSLRLLESIAFVYDMMFSSQSTAADDFSETLVGEPNLLRVHSHLKDFIGLDDIGEACSKLPPLAEDLAKSSASRLRHLLSLQTLSSAPHST